MELYRSSNDRTVYLDVPVPPTGTTIDATVWDGDDLVHTFNTVAYASNRFTVTLPFSLMQYDRSLRVNWKFPYVEDGEAYEYDDDTYVEIVTPILTFDEIRAILDDPEIDYSATDDEVYRIERAVRYIIQAHTGQSFGKYVGKKSVTGSGDSYLRLPARLISASSVNGNTFWQGSLALRGSGWFLRSKAYGVPPIRADWDGFNETTVYSSGAPISTPGSRLTHTFLQHVEYEIDGVWGWKAVPAAVKEAAKLLINDYACADTNYRDRFITSMTAADWRIQFHEGAFSNTGNVRANQLLAEFVLRRGWVVL